MRVKILIGLVLAAGVFSVRWAAPFANHDWKIFTFYLVATLLSSGMKVAMPKSDGTMCVNFPFILLGIVQLSPLQAMTLAALSVIAQCRFKVMRAFTLVQIAFNVGNVLCSVAAASFAFAWTTRLHWELAPALSAAATAYFFVNTVPVAVVIAWSKGERPFDLWRREFPWFLPFYLVGAMLAAAAHLISIKVGWMTSLLLVPVVYTIYRAYQAQVRMLKDRQQHLEETEALHFRTIEALAMAIEAKDQNTHDHLIRVRLYVTELGKSFGLDKMEMQALSTAAFLHDIGKLAVPEHIINKPGKLTKEEFEKMKIHPVVGADILERVHFPYPVVPIVRSHHERWDGAGYPDGLRGEEIPIGARILTVVDCFDAMASDRPYRRAMPLSAAMAIVKNNGGTQFDPRVVEVLAERYLELEEQARVQGNAITALNTDVDVSRGAAPAAGFQQDNMSIFEGGEEGFDEHGPSINGPTGTSHESLLLIAAASQEAQAIYEMEQMLGSSLSAKETASMMSSRLRRLIPFDCFALYQKLNGQLVSLFLHGDGARSFSAAALELGSGLTGWVAHSGKAILNGNPRVEPNYIRSAEPSEQMNSALSVPLFDMGGEIFAVLTVYSAGVDAFSADHLRILQAIELKFSLSLQNALRHAKGEAETKIQFSAPLPDMREFFFGLEAELNRTMRSGGQFGLAVCDLDSFQAVNDQHGRTTGDLLLRSVAKGFQSCCRSYDVVARMGGDEFVFLFPGVDRDTCWRQLECITDAVRTAGRELLLPHEVTGSAGAAFYPADGKTAEELLAVATRRMHVEKGLRVEAGEKEQHELRTLRAAVA